MFEILRSESGIVEAAASFQCDGSEFIEKHEPFAYEQNRLVIRAGCSVKVGCGSDAVLAVTTKISYLTLHLRSISPNRLRWDATTLYISASMGVYPWSWFPKRYLSRWRRR